MIGGKGIRLVLALAVLFLFCSGAAAGPVSQDGLELVEFKVDAPSSPKLGDVVNVNFILKNTSDKPITFDDKYGAFVSCQWSSDNGSEMTRDVGISYAGWKVFPGHSITVSITKIMDRAGTWRFAASYNVGGRTEDFNDSARQLQVAGSSLPVVADDERVRPSTSQPRVLASGGAGSSSGRIPMPPPAAEPQSSGGSMPDSQAMPPVSPAGMSGALNSGAGSTTVTYQGKPLPVQVFPPDNPWNTPVRDWPVHPNSNDFLTNIGMLTPVHADFGSGRLYKFYDRALKVVPAHGIPYIVVRNGTPTYPVKFLYAKESDPGPYPIPLDSPIENQGKGDAHVLALHYDQMRLYEIFAAKVVGNGWEAGSGAIWDLNSNKLRPLGWTSADAAGLPIFPGLVRYEEVATGVIKHALRFTVVKTRKAFILPATHWASSVTAEVRPPMGLRLRLRADFNIQPFPPQVRVILRCLQEYGMILADNGGDLFISGAPHPNWDDDALHYIGRVKGRDFEVVYTGPTVTRLP